MIELLQLAGLALVDSMSLGTLVIPLVLLIRWRGVRPAAYATYLGTVAGVYFALGVALLAGVSVLLDAMNVVSKERWFLWIVLVLGAALALFGILAPNPKRPGGVEEGESAAVRRVSAKVGATGFAALIGLGLVASLSEAATMVPYLAAIGIIQAMELAFGVKVLILLAYCGVMILPAIIDGIVVATVGDRIFPRLEKLIVRLEYEAKVTLLWIAAILGIIIVSRTAVRLGLLGLLG